MSFEVSKVLLTFGSVESPSMPQCPASNGEVDGHCGVAAVAFLRVVVVTATREEGEGGEEVHVLVDA